jgi:hypothetical protein
MGIRRGADPHSIPPTAIDGMVAFFTNRGQPAASVCSVAWTRIIPGLLDQLKGDYFPPELEEQLLEVLDAWI